MRVTVRVRVSFSNSNRESGHSRNSSNGGNSNNRSNVVIMMIAAVVEVLATIVAKGIPYTPEALHSVENPFELSGHKGNPKLWQCLGLGFRAKLQTLHQGPWILSTWRSRTSALIIVIIMKIAVVILLSN